MSKSPKGETPDSSSEKEMSFLDHLEELRWHIIRSIIAIVLIGILVFWQSQLVIDILFAPRFKTFPTYRFICRNFDVFCEVPQFQMIYKDLGERFFTHLKTSIWLGIILGFPYLFWEFWRFIKPGLYEHERKATRGMVGICTLLFFSGVLFGYFIIAPFAISFLAGYQFGTDDSEVSSTLSSYVSYMTLITLPTGIVFQLPVVAYFLGKAGIIGSDTMKKFRRHAIVVIFIMAAIITPPDIITQFLIALPLMGLYQIGIIAVKRIEKKGAQED